MPSDPQRPVGTDEPSGGPTAPIVLVGLSGAGKSTVGALLAGRWGLPFIDLDAEIERRSGLSIGEIFEREGEEGFRMREVEVTRQISPSTPAVIAAGGGWMAAPATRDAWPGAIRIWLEVPPEEAARRLASDSASRPLLANELPHEVLQRLLEARLPSYRLSEYTVGTSGRTPAEVADLVEAAIGRSGAPEPGLVTGEKPSTES